MPANLLRFLTLFALLLAPFGMIGGHAAMAMPSPAPAMEHQAMPAAPAGHCDGMAPDPQDQGASVDCMISCSSLAAGDYRVDAQPIEPAGIEPGRPPASLHGLNPESDPPPPRPV